jgi:hypothetical protein
MSSFPFARWRSHITRTPQIFPFPFTALGRLKSHVHPHLAIVNAAQKLEQHFLPHVSTAAKILGEQLALSERAVADLLSRVVALWEHWTSHASKPDLEWETGASELRTDGPPGCPSAPDVASRNPLSRVPSAANDDGNGVQGLVSRSGGSSAGPTASREGEGEGADGDPQRPHLNVRALPGDTVQEWRERYELWRAAVGYAEVRAPFAMLRATAGRRSEHVVRLPSPRQRSSPTPTRTQQQQQPQTQH